MFEEEGAVGLRFGVGGGLTCSRKKNKGWRLGSVGLRK